MKKLYILLTCSVILTGFILAEIIHVPGDFQSIQVAINRSSDGDTVLVGDGLYHDNIGFYGKAITVASHFLIDGDEAHIENTIIDGSQPSNPDTTNTVGFAHQEDNSSIISGFTITGGSGVLGEDGIYYYGGGFAIGYNSSPVVSHNIIVGNEADYGGGLFIYQSNPILINNKVMENTSTYGGGIGMWYSSPVIINSTIANNHGVLGGGFNCAYFSSPLIQNCLIYNNTAANSAGFWIGNSSIVDLMNSSITGNVAASHSGGIFLTGASLFMVNSIIADNEAVGGAGLYIQYPVDVDVTYSDIANNTPENLTGPQDLGALGLIDGVNQNGTACDVYFNIFEDPLFVGEGQFPYEFLPGSPCIDAGIPDVGELDLPELDIMGNPRLCDGLCDGNVIVDMGACEYMSPPPTTLHVPADFQTIQQAIDASVDGNIVLVAEGTYVENINFNGKAITVASHFLEDGDLSHIDYTIIDGSQPVDPDRGPTVLFESGEDQASVLTGFTITGGTGILSSEMPELFGGGVCIMYSAPSIIQNIVTGNNAYGGAGILCVYGSAPDIMNNSIFDNTAEYWGGGMFLLYDSSPYVTGNHVKENTASVGGGINVAQGSNPTIHGNLIHHNNATTGAGMYIYDTIAANLVNNDISHNYAGQYGGGFTSESATITMINCIVNSNHAGISAGAVRIYADSRLTLVNCTVSDNSAITTSGGVAAYGSGVSLVNTIVSGNSSQSGAALAFSVTDDINIQYGNFFDNAPADFAGTSLPEGLGEITTVNQNGTPSDVFYNIYEDPQYIGGDETPFGLLALSPCIDAGMPDTEGLPEFDIYGNTRMWDGNDDGLAVVDIGAAEYVGQPSQIGDVNSDLEVDILDVMLMVNFILGYQEFSDYQFWAGDVNQDGDINILDIVALVLTIVGEERGYFQTVEKCEIISTNGSVSIQSDGNIAGGQLEVSGAFSITGNHLPTGWQFHHNGPTILFFSTDGSSLDSDLIFNYTGELIIEEAIIADRNGESITATSNIQHPTSISLFPAYPNPFNPVTTITYQLPKAVDISIAVYDLQGRVVKTLVNAYQLEGRHSIDWNAAGQSSGLYLIRMQTPDSQLTDKVLLLK